jgi:LPS sulfotransferase NodH
VLEVGTTRNGLFGAKLQWNNLRWAIEKFRELPQFTGCTRAEVLHRALPNLHVIHVLRRDWIRQAVSWSRMAQDGVWVVTDEDRLSRRQRPTTAPS